MAITTRVCNPTPWMVDFPYDQGIDIVVPPFGSALLTMEQMDDFRDGKPGSEAVQELLDYYGLFLLDSDRPYDNQAHEVLVRCRAKRLSQYTEAERNIKDRRASQGIAPDEAALEAMLETMGYTALREQVNILEEQINHFKDAVTTESTSSAPKFDPARTIFVMDPPTEFPSVAAMKFFLMQPENADIASAHESFSGAQE